MRCRKRIIFKIDYDPLIWCSFTLKSNAQIAAYIRVTAITGNQVLGTDCFCIPLFVLQVKRYTLGILTKLGQLT